MTQELRKISIFAGLCKRALYNFETVYIFLAVMDLLYAKQVPIFCHADKVGRVRENAVAEENFAIQIYTISR